MQVIHKSMPLIFELTDLSVHEGKDTKDTVLAFAKKNTVRKFDLVKGPLMATVSSLYFYFFSSFLFFSFFPLFFFVSLHLLCLFVEALINFKLAVVLPKDECIIHLSMHHVIADAWTLNIMFTELMRIYAGETLPKAALQYADYSVC